MVADTVRQPTGPHALLFLMHAKTAPALYRNLRREKQRTPHRRLLRSPGQSPKTTHALFAKTTQSKTTHALFFNARILFLNAWGPPTTLVGWPLRMFAWLSGDPLALKTLKARGGGATRTVPVACPQDTKQEGLESFDFC